VNERMYTASKQPEDTKPRPALPAGSRHDAVDSGLHQDLGLAAAAHAAHLHQGPATPSPRQLNLRSFEAPSEYAWTWGHHSRFHSRDAFKDGGGNGPLASGPS
jgi:hypothetical protein